MHPPANQPLRRRATLAGALACAIALLPLATVTTTQAGTLVSGPMLGYRAHRETAITLDVKNAHEIRLDYAVAGQPETSRSLTLTAPWTTPAGTQPVKFVLPLLDVGTDYTYSITIDGEPQTFAYPLTFSTASIWQWRQPPPDFSFIFGSCAYLNDAPYDRPGKPYGKTVETFVHMGESGADFMVWGGDNLYLREGDMTSASGIWYRYSHDRATPELQKLYAAMNHYATWDDHDYGPDNANKSYEFKDVTLAAFTTYWANPTWGQPDNPGVHGKFTWEDAAFFLMDDRYHRDETTLDQDRNPRKSVWGQAQIDWLHDSLLAAQRDRHNTFKFIVTGGQFLQSTEKTTRSETHELYRHEREALLRFIAENNITGVVFLTGDVHHSALYRHELDDGRQVYELTSSPFSSGSWDAAASAKAKDPALVPGTVVGTQNYCQLALSGPLAERRLTVRCLDSTNQLRWTREIAIKDLKPTPVTP